MNTANMKKIKQKLLLPSSGREANAKGFLRRITRESRKQMNSLAVDTVWVQLTSAEIGVKSWLI